MTAAAAPTPAEQAITDTCGWYAAPPVTRPAPTAAELAAERDWFEGEDADD